MKFKVSQTALALFFGAALIAAPAVFGAKGPLAYHQAFAGPGKSGDHGKGKEHATSAKQHSQTANKHTEEAHSKSQQQK